MPLREGKSRRSVQSNDSGVGRRRGPPPEGLLPALVPLFPLDLVLLPGVSQALHIFEPRYKQMIGECLEQKKTFGIVRSQEDGIAGVGCTGEIVNVVKKYPDGRMDIVVEGRQRFEVVEVNQDMAYLRAEIMFLDDEPGRPTAEETSRAAQLYRDILALAGEDNPQMDTGHPQFSFHLAGSLPLDLDFKQTLLGTGSEVKRVQAIIAYFEAILPNLRRSVHVRRKAGGNGHAG